VGAPEGRTGCSVRAYPSVVIAHDFLETYGGAERVTEELARAFPDAPVVALLGRESVAERMGIASRFRSVLPARERLLQRYRGLAPVLPNVARAVRLADADVLLSSSYGFSHRMRAPRGAVHVSYCHSPLRFAWSMTSSYRDRWAHGLLSARAFDAFAAWTRSSDRRSVRRIDRFLTQSPFTAEQIHRFYGRHAEVIGAPVDCQRFRPSAASPEDYFLLVARLVEPYKRVAMTIDAFRRLPQRLVVAGEGPELARLRRAAPPNVQFVGHLADGDLVPLMQRCAAAVFASLDDFGLVPLETMACGRPVLAYAGGGATYTVRPGLTGALFDAQTAEALGDAVRAFDPGAYDPVAIRRHALYWDAPAFRQRVVKAVREAAAGVGEGAAQSASGDSGEVRAWPGSRGHRFQDAQAGINGAPAHPLGHAEPSGDERTLA
jgi:glycosyltransferase involved in cell wall biosynthesis